MCVLIACTMSQRTTNKDTPSMSLMQSMIYCPTAPADYTSVSDEPLTFTRSSSSQSVNITIRDDTTVEDTESFVASLSVNATLYPGVGLLPDTANIYIIDPDSKAIHSHNIHSVW